MFHIATYRSQSGEQSFPDYDSAKIGWYRPNDDAFCVIPDSSDGNVFGLLNKDSELYQDIATIPGATYKWTVSHASCSTTALTPSVQVLIGAPGSETAQPAYRDTSNGNDTTGDVGTTSPTNCTGKIIYRDETENRNGVHYCVDWYMSVASAWENYSGEYTVPAGQTITRFTFRNTDQQGRPATEAVNVIDNVSFSIICPIRYIDALTGKVIRTEDVPAYTSAPEIENASTLHKDDGYSFTGYFSAKSNGESVNLSEITKPMDIYLVYEPDPLPIQVQSNTDGFGSATVAWDGYNYRNKNFKVYQSSDNGATWNTVGIDYRSVEKVRCLQIYPIEAAKDQIKNWMEDNGYGKGIIETDAVYIDDFNDDPNKYLKDASGNWQYDVIFFGTWDSNAGKDLSTFSTEAVQQHIKAGRGIVFGHDTIVSWTYWTRTNFCSLASLAGLSIPNPLHISCGNAQFF